MANPGVLWDKASQNTYNSVFGHIEYYLATKNVVGHRIIVTNEPHYNDSGQLLFSFRTSQSSSEHSVVVDTSSFGGGISSNTVYIDYNRVTYSVANSLYGKAFTDFDSLTDNGLSSVQAYQIESLLLHNLKGNYYTVDTDTLRQSNTSDALTISFDFNSNGKTYHARNTSTGLTDVNLSVSDSSDNPVFSAKESLSN